MIRLALKKSISQRYFSLYAASATFLFFSLAFNTRKSKRDNHLPVIYLPDLVETPLIHANEGRFSVLTYNIAGLPQFISSAVTNRSTSIADIGRKIHRYDIVHVQEDFNYNKNLYGAVNNHPYRTVTKGPVLFGDGLNTLSKYPVREIRRIPWEDCTNADCLTPKGFSYSRIEIAKGVFIDFYNVHANATNQKRAAAARRKNIKQLSDYIKVHSKNNAVIVMGDLNARYGYYYDNVKDLLTDNGLADTWLLLHKEGLLPEPLKERPDDNILSLTDSCESIDKILFRNSTMVKLQPEEYHLEKSLFTDAQGRPLSDHCPVSVSFSWKLH